MLLTRACRAFSQSARCAEFRSASLSCAQHSRASKKLLPDHALLSRCCTQVSELGLEKFVVGVVKHSPVTDGCIPLRWCLSEQDVLACKLVPGNTDSSESVSLTACPEEMQGYLQQVAQCTSIRTIALGEVKVVAEQCVDALQVCTAPVHLPPAVLNVVMPGILHLVLQAL